MKFIYLFLIFIFMLGCEKDPGLPTVTAPIIGNTTPASGITSSSAISGGSVTSAGWAAIIERGVCWSTSPMPTTKNDRTVDTGAIGTFTSTITALLPATVYFARAYASNNVGVSYSTQISFITLGTPVISTDLVNNITSNTAISGGTISNSGSSAITAKGVCWGTSLNPTIALTTKTSNGTGSANFVGNITGLLTATSYYVRAYATNAAGTSYGSNILFRTN